MRVRGLIQNEPSSSLKTEKSTQGVCRHFHPWLGFDHYVTLILVALNSDTEGFKGDITVLRGHMLPTLLFSG